MSKLDRSGATCPEESQNVRVVSQPWEVHPFKGLGTHFDKFDLPEAP